MIERKLVEQELARLPSKALNGDRSAELSLAYASILSLRHDPGAEVATVLQAIDAGARGTGRVAPAQLLAVARCQMLVPRQRVTCLQEIAGPRLYATDVALHDALASAGRNDEAAALARLLTAPQGLGRAVAEHENLDLLVANLVDAQRLRQAPSR
jgi:hypothetical protein